ncbi:TPA: hypothetical protein IYD21_001244 [Enterococcus faecium]|nr:hypothetical protein [Enterococcus faecium]HBC2692412.1 hypothetical protein [Enterococcus faecium]
MASSLYNLALDFSKELNYTKAIMARQGDKGITVTVKPFLNGLQMDTSGGTFTLKGTTPSNRYVDSVATSVTSEEVTFSLDGTFMSEAGYYKHCYVEYRKDNQILTTQDIIFFSLGVSDISQGQADEYVSQLEELIQKYNETFDAFMKEITDKAGNIQTQLDQMGSKATELEKELARIQEQINALDLDKWLTEAKAYTDERIAIVNKTLSDTTADLTKNINANTTNITTNTTNIGKNTSDIGKNTTAIATNTTAISDLSTKVDKRINDTATTTFFGNQGEVSNKTKVAEYGVGTGYTTTAVGETHFERQSNGYVKCLKAGKYSISAQIRVQLGGKYASWLYTDLYKDGTSVDNLVSYGVDALQNRFAASGNIVTNLEVNDVLNMRTEIGVADGILQFTSCRTLVLARLSD